MSRFGSWDTTHELCHLPSLASVSFSIKWENNCPTIIGLMGGYVSCNHHPVALSL